MSNERIETKLIHAGEMEPVLGAVTMPIFQSSTYLYSGATSYHDLRYIRLNNTPNHVVLHDKLAALENAEAAVVTASGMAAITTALAALLKPGEHLLAQKVLYGGTYDFLRFDSSSLGISFDTLPDGGPESWKRALRPETRAIYVESISNPLMGVIDLRAVVAFAREHGLISIIDNTFTTPIGFRPAEWGFDISLHSGTKYLNGHSDIVAGAVIGSRELIDRVKHKLAYLGGSLDPHAAFLLHRGMKTLALRVRCQSASALAIARFLESHRDVASVNYPGLGSHPQHALAQELFDCFGGMLSFELRGGLPAADRFLSRVKLPKIAPSLGGVESLMTRPATTSHAGMPADERRAFGISDSLVRVSVGIEATEDLIEDIRQALEQ